MNFKSIVFWLEYPLFHISPLIKSVSEQSGLKTIVVCEKQIPQWRLDMGFVPPDFGVSDVYVEPTSKVRKKIEKTFSDKESMHVFHGLRGVKKNHKSFNKLTKAPCSLGLYFEPSVFGGTPKGVLRKQIYRALFFKIKKHIDVLFALGDMGKYQYINLRVDPNKVYSVPYFIDDDKVISNINEKKKGDIKTVKLLYVGQLIARKNVVLLIRAIHKIIKSGRLVELNIVGSGEQDVVLKKLVRKLKLDEHVNFLGNKDQNELQTIYLENDIFVLPSLFDGWGAVSVEAMANGLPVVISDNCSSSSIVNEKMHGAIFKNNSLSSLVSSLNNIIDDIDSYWQTTSIENRLDYVFNNLTASSGNRIIINALDEISKK